MNLLWINDWMGFVYSVAADHVQGLGDTEISKKYGGCAVRWFGKIAELKLRNEYAPGVRMEMPAVAVALGANQRLEAMHLFLVISDATRGSWAKAMPGSDVEFETTLIVGNGPFSGISLAAFDDGLVSLEIGTRDAKLLCPL